MDYRVNGFVLRTVREVYSCSVNDLYVCEDLNGPMNSYYSVLMIKDHEYVKRFLEIVTADTGKPSKCYIDTFTCPEGFGVVFPYVKERMLVDFYMGENITLQVSETICINLIMESISTMLPYPLLYLVLKQNQIHLRADNSIQFGCPRDLTDMDSSIGEEECVVLCATILRDLLVSKEKEKAVSYELITMKITKQSYSRFKDLYFDVKMAATNPKKNRFFFRIKEYFMLHQRTIFRLLLVIAIVLAIFAIVTLISQMVTGDIGILKIFINTFRYIGTESLRK